MNASDAAIKLNIAKDTLRAYSLELERAGYEVKRNNRNQRDYSNYDILIFRAFLTLSKTHGLTLKEAASKVSSADFTPSNVIEDNAERESVVSNATSLQALKTADLEDIFKSMELMAGHVATLERDNTVLLERLSVLESKQDMTLRAIEHPKESAEFKHMQNQIDTMIMHQTKLDEITPNTNALMAEIRKLNSKIAELETLATTEQTKGGFWSRLFKK